MKTDGVYFGMRREEYEGIDRANWSWIKHLKRSGLHFQAIKALPFEDTDSLRLGCAFHTATLEPERFTAEWTVWDGGRRQGGKWDAFKASAEANAMGILTAEQYETVMAMVTACRGYGPAQPYLAEGAAEVSVLWTHEEPANGLPGFKVLCKARLDFGSNKKAILDLKSTKDASPEAFARQCWNLDYDAQAAMYVDGYAQANGGELLPYFILAVESTAPHVCQLYEVKENRLDMGRDTYKGLLRRYAECRDSGNYSGYAEGVLELGLPRWAQPDGGSDLGLDVVVGDAVL